jgi:hypothetical protein
MAENLGDLFRRLADEHLESPEDRSRFMKAALVVLRLDPEIRRRPHRERAKLGLTPKGKAAPDLIGPVVFAILKLAHDVKKADSLTPPLRRRVFAALAVLKGLPPHRGKNELREAETVLWRIWDDAETSRRQEEGQKGRAKRVAKERESNKEKWDAIEREASKIQRTYRARDKSYRVRALMDKFPGKWGTFDAARSALNRRRIVI